MYIEQREREGIGKSPGEEESFCLKCKDGGDVLLCDFEGCVKSYHMRCCSLKKVPEGLWECPRHRCINCGSGPSQTDSQGHKREPDGAKLRPCRTCPVTYCDRCLPEASMSEGDTGEVVCVDCQELHHSDNSLLERDLMAWNPDLFTST